MTSQPKFYKLHQTSYNHDFTLPEAKVEVCSYAGQFSSWVDQQLAEVLQEPDLIKIAQAKLLILEQFFQYRMVAPKSHRTLTSATADGRGHRCLWAVFEDSYRQLKSAELKLSPPQLYVPVPSPMPMTATPQIAGVFIGELDDD